MAQRFINPPTNSQLREITNKIISTMKLYIPSLLVRPITLNIFMLEIRGCKIT